jgi:hypothetical protein
MATTTNLATLAATRVPIRTRQETFLAVTKQHLTTAQIFRKVRAKVPRATHAQVCRIFMMTRHSKLFEEPGAAFHFAVSVNILSSVGDRCRS